MEEDGGLLPAPASLPSPSLPDEMVFEFLLRLPIKNLHQCNCVSKGWRSLIGSPGFIQAYKVRHPDVGLVAVLREPIELAIVGINNFCYSTLRFHEPEDFICRFQLPCPGYHCDQFTEVIDGLVCFNSQNGLFLCNIFTGEISPLPNSSGPRKYFLGFDVVNGVYKLLGINLHSIEILTLGLGGSDCRWRRISDDFENGGKITSLVPELSVRVWRLCVSGVLYWMVVRNTRRRKARCCLVSFDLNKERFGRIKVPRGMTSLCLMSHCLTKFRGRMALSLPTFTGGYRLSLRILEDGEGNSWTKHSISLPEGLNMGHGRITIPVGNLPDGRMLLVNPLVDEAFSTPVYAYDHRTCKFERFFVGRFPFFGWSIVGQCAGNISCMEENLIPFRDLFSGVNRR